MSRLRPTRRRFLGRMQRLARLTGWSAIVLATVRPGPGGAAPLPGSTAAPTPTSSSSSPSPSPSPTTTSTTTSASMPQPLDAQQSAAFRRWFVAIVNEQISRAPTPRWVHRDCAGLVRFAAAEALRRHDERWLQAMGWDRTRPRPPELDLRPDQDRLGRLWQLPAGATGAFAGALALVQLNAQPVGRDRTAALPGDLLFFDQGDDQHLMVWTGGFVAYHTGADPTPTDNGLRRLRWEQLLDWPDTRWRPALDNPNFAGLYRLSFLT